MSTTTLPLVGWARRHFLAATAGAAILPLVVLFFIYFFDEFDTAAFGVLNPEIQKAFHLTDLAFALLVILNISVVLLAAIPIGHYADHLPRTKLVFWGAVLAGLFSFGTGIAPVLGILVLVRLGNGVGIIVNDPVHTSLLNDYYPPDRWAEVVAFHRNAVRLGAVIGPMVAGIMAQLFNWRAAFIIIIVPVLTMAWFSRRLENPVRGISQDADAALVAAQERPPPFARATRMLFAVRTLRRQYAAWIFIGAGFIPLAFVIPRYFQRVFGLGPFERGVIGSVSAAAAFIAIRLAGKWTVRWLAVGLGEPLKRAGWILVAVGPGLFLLGLAPTLWIAVPLAVATSFVGAIFTPAFVTVQAMVSPARVRSLSFGFGLLFIVIGVWVLYLNPVLGIASLSDKAHGAHGVRLALEALLPFWVIGGLILRSGHRFVAEDATRAFAILAQTAELRRKRLDSSTNSILVVRDLDVSYGPVQVLFGVDLDLGEGEIIALLGTNGAGKSTLLRAISGLVPMQRGTIFFDGEDITGLEPEDSFALGMVQVPGGRGIFPGLTARENLEVAAWASRRADATQRAIVDEIFDLFPQVARRADQPASVLSGGEQQMLTLGQALIARPKLLMIDELSLGLAPIVVESLLEIVERIHQSGTAVVLVEQSVNLALTIAQRACFMEKGEIRFMGPTADLLERDDILRAVFLGGAAVEGAR
jgi:branched-chain amino acid transport system ATP-binding protein